MLYKYIILFSVCQAFFEKSFKFLLIKMKKAPPKAMLFLVPVIGVEPIRYRYHWILSPARLPIPSHRRFKERFMLTTIFIITYVFEKIKPCIEFFSKNRCEKNS